MTKAVSGCGTTHLALAIANTLASKEKYRVLYIECTDAVAEGSEGIILLRTDHVIEVLGLNGFRRKGVDFLPRCLSSDTTRVLDLSDYEAIVVEVDCRSKELDAAVRHCDRHLIIGSAKPWRYRELQEFLKTTIQESDTMQGEVCLFGMTEAERRRLVTEFHLRAVALPYILDPYRLTLDDVRAVEQLIRLPGRPRQLWHNGKGGKLFCRSGG